MSDESIKLGKYIKVARGIHKLRQTDLAARAQITRAALIRLEKGEEVNLSTFLRVIEALGCVGRMTDSILPGFSINAVDHLLLKNKKIRPQSKEKYDF